MRFLIVLVQVIVSLVITASVMPVIFITVPAAQNQRVGLGLMAGVLVVAFCAVSLVWPARKRRT